MKRGVSAFLSLPLYMVESLSAAVQRALSESRQGPALPAQELAMRKE